jgi:uncharacterized protein YdeI (YjbR/CyaY-like superfamily)
VKDAPHIEAKTRRQWRQWLSENHASSKGVWLVTYKKATGIGDLDYATSVEEALCFAWVDSRPGKVDEQRSKLWFAPRQPKSAWSKLNKDRVERLQREGLMAAPGLALVELAKATGTWAALDDVEAMKLPPGLRQALAANPQAAAYFEAFPPSAKKGILQWIQSAKRDETRTKRIQQTVELAAVNKRANSWPRPD